MDNVHLLDPLIQDGVRQALVDGGFTGAEAMTDESIIALASLGEQPSDMRGPLLIILPIEARAQLVGERLIEYHEDGDPAHWTLTQEGECAADVASAALPELLDDEVEVLEDEYQRQLVEAERDLRLRPEEDPPV